MKKERIIEKVLKVLELSKNNPNQEEATAAALKAQALMAEYHIDMTDLDSIVGTVEKIEGVRSYTGTGKKWKYSLASVITKNFRCRVYYSGSSYCVFYGYKTDAAIAKEVFENLLIIGHKSALKHRADAKKNGFSSNGVYNSYVVGFVRGVKEALEQQCTALMIIVPKEVNESYEEMSASWRCCKSTALSTSGSSYSKTAYERGRVDGKDVAGKKKLA